MNQIALDLQPADSSYRLIQLTQGQFTKVSPEDFESLSQWKWFAQWDSRAKQFRAARGCPVRILMHRQILGLVKGEEGDHINHDTLDNRRENLRKATRSQNCMNRRTHRTNSLGVKGIRKVKDCDRYVARVMVGGKEKYLGCFATIEAAVTARAAAVTELHGEFAHA